MRAPFRLIVLLFLAATLLPLPAIAAGPRFSVSFPKSVARSPVTGRLLIIANIETDAEPRETIGLRSPALFGVDVEGVTADAPMAVDVGAIGYPMENLSKLPAGDYYVQALLVRYTQAKRADGHTVWVPVTNTQLPPFALPGNLYSRPQKVHLDGASGYDVALSLTETIGPVAEPKDTEWVKHVLIKSRLLSEFWGVPMYIGAHVLLPKDFNAHPQARYPAVYAFGHGDTPFAFNPDPASHERALPSARDANLQTGYELYQSWTSPGFPRLVAITLRLPCPYFVESYAIDSANNGPWGQALTQELLPYLEKTFRLIPQSYARLVEGASTGGWEALAVQLHHPEVFGGAWVFNPDPIDFSRYQLVDIYRDENMFSTPLSPTMSVERPFRRTREGQPLQSVRQLARLEAVFGSHGRSGYQFGIWQSTHGPVGADGYPQPLFDPLDGKIDHQVAEYMREHGYDLTEYTRRSWPALGPKLIDKLHFFAGEQDDFFLNLGVYNYEAMLQQMTNPQASARFYYGRPRKGHNWHLKDWAQTLRDMSEHIVAHAPAGENTEQWHY